MSNNIIAFLLIAALSPSVSAVGQIDENVKYTSIPTVHHLNQKQQRYFKTPQKNSVLSTEFFLSCEQDIEMNFLSTNRGSPQSPPRPTRRTYPCIPKARSSPSAAAQGCCPPALVRCQQNPVVTVLAECWWPYESPSASKKHLYRFS